MYPYGNSGRQRVKRMMMIDDESSVEQFRIAKHFQRECAMTWVLTVDRTSFESPTPPNNHDDRQLSTRLYSFLLSTVVA